MLRRTHLVAVLGLVVVSLAFVAPTLATPRTPDAPTITGLNMAAMPDGSRSISGSTVNCPPGTVITFSGPDGLDGQTAVVDQYGGFHIIVTLPAGSSGDASATGTTPGGQSTNAYGFYVPA
jgi:hypothetical protein